MFYNEYMVRITSRQKKILLIISKHGTITGKLISDISGFSLRTIQYEISQLKKLGIIDSGNYGYKIINHKMFSEYDSNNDKQMILKKLLLNDSDTEISIFDLCDELYISETTLHSRLDDVLEFINEYNLSLNIKNNFITIVGTELAKRKLLRDLILSELSNEPLIDGSIQSFFPQIDIELISNIIRVALEKYGYTLQMPYLNNLVVNISIVFFRISKSIHTPKEIEFPREEIEFSIAKEIIKQYKYNNNINYTENDLSFIARLLQGQISKRNLQKNTDNIIDSDFYDKISKLLFKVFNNYMISIDSTDFSNGLLLHVFELIRRGHVNNYVIDSHQIFIKESSPFVYDVAVHFAREIEKNFNVSIPDVEIAFLAIHIGLIISKKSVSNYLVSILLYSSDYQNISETIENKLYEEYNNQIIVQTYNPYSKRMAEDDFDLIITNLKVDFIGKRIVEISPFFDIVDRAKVNLEINKIIKEKEIKLYKENLISFFDSNLFFITSKFDNKNEVLSFLSKKLLEQKIVNEGFYKSVLEREALSPTCFFDSFALPHAIEQDSTKTKFAVLINTDGINWGTSNIKLCIMIATRKEDLHIFRDSYNGLVKILTDQRKLVNLIQSNSFEMFINNISKY